MANCASLIRPELQISRSYRDNFSYVSMKTYIVTLHLNSLCEPCLLIGLTNGLMENNGKLCHDYPCNS